MARKDLMPALAMVMVQVGYAGLNISSKVVMDSGMPPLVLVAYRQIFATLAIIPLALFLERKTRPKITKKVLFQIFLSSLFGATFNQMFYFVGLSNSSPTTSSALTNMLPAMTFLIAVPFGLERVGFKTKGGQAKIWGTALCIGGAMILSLYHGPVVKIPQPNFRLAYLDHARNNIHSTSHHNSLLLGPFLVLIANLAFAIWFILQKKVSEGFSAPYTSSALLCFMSAIQSISVAVCTNHKLADWYLNSRMRLIGSLYAGFVGSAMAICLMSWTIQQKGPLYASVFSPLMLVNVAILSWALRLEKLYVGTLMGASIIVIGLYSVLWGKSKEMKSKTLIIDPNVILGQVVEHDDLEKQEQQLAVYKDKQQQIVVINGKIDDQ